MSVRAWVSAWLVPALLLISATAGPAAAQAPADPSPSPAQQEEAQQEDEQEYATRAEANRARREARSQTAETYEPNKVEEVLDYVEDHAVFLLDREGVYPKLGSLSVSSGFAYGIGFRDRDLFQNQGALDLWGAASIRQYWGLEARMTFPRLANRRLRVESWAGHRDSPQENFFGLGPDAQRANRSDYALRSTYAGALAGVQPIDEVLVGGSVEFLRPRVRPGGNDDFRNIDDLFTPGELPGLESRSNFVRTSVFAELDYREPRNARRGGRYRIDFSHYDDRTHGLRTFNRTDIDLSQFIGFFGDRRVIAARAFVSTSDTAAGQVMPFYFMPTLGGNDTLRGFRVQRFRGPHAILLQAEYRWEIWSALDAALFYDAGKVANRREDLDFKDLESDYGIGFRFNTRNGIILRVDGAFGSRDGKHLHIVFGGIF